MAKKVRRTQDIGILNCFIYDHGRCFYSIIYPCKPCSYPMYNYKLIDLNNIHVVQPHKVRLQTTIKHISI